MTENCQIARILSQLDDEYQQTPEKIVAVTEELAQYLESMVEGIEFDMGAPLEEDG